jgi:hypothetical protein
MSYRIFFLALLFFGCGLKPANNTNINNQTGVQEGQLNVPLQGIFGSGSSLYFGGTHHYVNTNGSSFDAMSVLNQITNQQINIAPISQTGTAYIYRVRFIGNFSQGTCPLNPSIQCPLVSLQSLQPY